ncbi:MAG TPA: hypothetical protein VMI10_24695 [Terriglobales bacterium]|nr:hypothetical protein [Terriglobales bacterium]
MDQDRQIRFIIPPFFLFASLLVGRYLSCGSLPEFLKADSGKEIVALLAATAVITIPLGYLISTISVFILRLLARLFREPTYEAVVTDHVLKRIWSLIKHDGEEMRRSMLYATTTFDHEILSDGVHMWLLRRWNSFNISVHSAVALTIALAVAPLFSIQLTRYWWLSTLGFVALFLNAAFTAWREVMTMIEFQSHRPQEHSSSENEKNKRKPPTLDGGFGSDAKD